VGNVWLWWVDVRSVSEAVVQAWAATLDASERDRAARFRFATDRAAYVAAHALARVLLSRVCGRPTNAWRFVAGPYGKPRVHASMGVEIDFNLSHTRGLAAVAACAGADVGVDVEGTIRRHGLGVAEYHFAPAEVDALRRLQPAPRQEAFLQLWTLKEAWSKATGRGLTSRLDAAVFVLEPFSVDLSAAGEDASAWQFHRCAPTAEHVLALAVRRSGREIPLERVVAREVRHQELVMV
jgi:4'-phosphopantetheinyl transferase